jgi:hypothetical protein
LPDNNVTTTKPSTSLLSRSRGALAAFSRSSLLLGLLGAANVAAVFGSAPENPTALATPAVPRAMALASVTISLTWDANLETDLAGYKVYWGTAPRTYKTPPTTIDKSKPSYSFVGFTTGTYYFAVTAFNTAGQESGYSNEVASTILPTPPTYQAPVTGPIAYDATTNSVRMMWKTDVPATTRIEYQYTGGPFVSLVIDRVAVTDHYVRITGLSSNKVYSYSVYNLVGTTETKATGTFKTQ